MQFKQLFFFAAAITACSAAACPAPYKPAPAPAPAPPATGGSEGGSQEPSTGGSQGGAGGSQGGSAGPASQKIIASLKGITDAMDNLGTVVGAFNGGIPEALKIQKASSSLDDAIKACTSTVQGAGQLSDADAVEVVTAVAELPAKAEGSTGALLKKADQLKNFAGIVANTVKKLQASSKELSDALGKACGPANAEAIKAGSEQLDKTFSDVIAKFGN